MKKKTAEIIAGALAVVAIALGVLTLTGARTLADSERVGDIYGEKALGELATSLNSMEEQMEKSLYAGSPEYMSELCSKTAANASSALSALGMLPYQTSELEKLAGLLNTTGDYALWLSRTTAAGTMPDKAASDGLRALYELTKLIAERTELILRQYQEGALTMDDYGDGQDAESSDTVGAELLALEKELGELPRLEYDGQFSVTADREPLFIKDAAAVTEETAKQSASKFLGIPSERLRSEGKTEGEIPAYHFTFSMTDSDTRRVVVTEKGGVVASLSSSRVPGQGSTTPENAARIAAGYLSRRGYENMRELTRETKDGLTVSEFCYVDGEVWCLADTITVAVSLDTGEVSGFEAGEYIQNHHTRAGLRPEVDAKELAGKIPEGFSVRAYRLTLDRNQGGEEKIFWNFNCENGDNCKISVFFDAKTAKETKIEIVET